MVNPSRRENWALAFQISGECCSHCSYEWTTHLLSCHMQYRTDSARVSNCRKRFMTMNTKKGEMFPCSPELDMLNLKWCGFFSIFYWRDIVNQGLSLTSPALHGDPLCPTHTWGLQWRVSVAVLSSHPLCGCNPLLSDKRDGIDICRCKAYKGVDFRKHWKWIWTVSGTLFS